MAVSQSHRSAQRKAAGKGGRTEVPISGNRRVDAQSKNKKSVAEIERSGNPKLLDKAASRLKASPSPQKQLRVPQKDMDKAVEAMRRKRVSGSVSNLGGTKRRHVK